MTGYEGGATMLAYRCGLPFWKWFAKLGGTIKIRLLVIRDDEAGVFVATSPDLRGLVCEADSLDSLNSSVEKAIIALLECELKSEQTVQIMQNYILPLSA